MFICNKLKAKMRQSKETSSMERKGIANRPLAVLPPVLRMGSAALILVLAARVNATLDAQLVASGLVMLLVWAISLIWRDYPERRGYEVMRCAMIFITLMMSLRYLIWRGTETLPFHLGAAAAIVGVLLFGAE